MKSSDNDRVLVGSGQDANTTVVIQHAGVYMLSLHASRNGSAGAKCRIGVHVGDVKNTHVAECVPTDSLVAFTKMLCLRRHDKLYLTVEDAAGRSALVCANDKQLNLNGVLIDPYSDCAH